MKRTHTGKTKKTSAAKPKYRPYPTQPKYREPEMGLGSRLGPEYKWKDNTPGSVSAADTTGAFVLLNGMVRGTDASANRIGRKILVKQILIKGSVATNLANNFAAGGVCGGQDVRMIVFVDRDSNGVAPLVTDVLVTSSSLSHYNLDNRDRFKILYDKMYWLAQASNTAAGGNVAAAASPQGFTIDVDIPCNIVTIYNSNVNGNATDIQSGAIWILTVGSSAASSTNAAGYDLSTRIRFTDA